MAPMPEPVANVIIAGTAYPVISFSITPPPMTPEVERQLRGFWAKVEESKRLNQQLGGEMYRWSDADQVIDCCTRRGVQVIIVGADEHVCVLRPGTPLPKDMIPSRN